jgi:hypothetical protein
MQMRARLSSSIRSLAPTHPHPTSHTPPTLSSFHASAHPLNIRPSGRRPDRLPRPPVRPPPRPSTAPRTARARGRFGSSSALFYPLPSYPTRISARPPCAQVRVQFRSAPAAEFLFTEGGARPVPRNELVMRLQPNEAIYMKMNVKEPGFRNAPTQSSLDLTYRSRFDKVQPPPGPPRSRVLPHARAHWCTGGLIFPRSFVVDGTCARLILMPAAAPSSRLFMVLGNEALIDI